MWTFNGKKCSGCNRCCYYYSTVDLQEIDIDNLLSIGFSLEKHINVSERGKAYLKVGPCPFLKDNLCDIQKTHGFSFKPLRCQFYPYIPEIISGKVQISLFKACPGVELGNNRDLGWIEKAFLENHADRPTMYRLLYGHYVTRSAFVEFTEYYWADIDVTDDSLLAFLSNILYFSEDKRKILNKGALKVYLDKGDIKNTITSIKHSWKIKIAKNILNIYSRIILFMIDINHPKIDYRSYNNKNRQGNKTMNDYVMDKARNIRNSALFTSYAALLPRLCAIQNLKIKTKNDLHAIKLFETQYEFADFRTKRLISILNNFVPWILLILNPAKKQHFVSEGKPQS